MKQGYAETKIRNFNIIFIVITALSLILLMGCATTEPKSSRLEAQKAELEAAGFQIDYMRK
jgi:hypothetical protein